MDYTKIIIGLIVVVLGLFIFQVGPFANNDSSSSTLFSVTPTQDKITEVTEISCQTDVDCVDFARDQGTEGDIDAECVNKFCVYSVPAFIVGETE